jgi:hypothetical protein
LFGRGTPPEAPAGGNLTPVPPTPPILTSVEALLQQGRSREATLLAYQTAEDDVRRAFGMKLPPQWTHRQFVHRYLRTDMGSVSVLLPQLHTIFEPVRYGGTSEIPIPLLTELLRSLYEEPALRRFQPSTSSVAPGSMSQGPGLGVVRSAPKAPGPPRGKP